MRRALRTIRRFYWGSGLSDDVPSLAWYLVGACAPLALGVAALATIVLRDEKQAERVAARLGHLLGPEVQDQVATLVLRTKQDSPLLLAIAIISMVWASAGATGVIERVQSRLLGAQRPGMIALKLRHLALAFGMALLIALMALAATAATDLERRIGIDVPTWVSVIGGTLLMAVLCALLYRFATTVRLGWRAAFIGALPAAVILRMTPVAASYYTKAVVGRTAAQVFLVLGGLLFACFILAQGFLIGVGLAVRAHRWLASAT